MITFLDHQRTKSQKKTAFLFVSCEAGAYQSKPLDAQENRSQKERDADGLTAEILETRSGQTSPVNDW